MTTLSLACVGVELHLRRAFGTSHSTTTKRTNGLVTATITSAHASAAPISGYGEAGLPPKKPGVYYSTLDDCLEYVAVLQDRIKAVTEQAAGEQSKDPQGIAIATEDDSARVASVLQHVPAEYFAMLREAAATGLDDGARAVLMALQCMDGMEAKAEWRAPRNAVETALLDVLARASMSSSIATLLGGPMARVGNGGVLQGKRAYFTVGMNSDLAEEHASMAQGLALTGHIKLKVNADVDATRAMMGRLHAAVSEAVAAGQIPSWDPEYVSWALDANAAWTPQVARQMLPLLSAKECTRPGDGDASEGHVRSLVYMVEQPFPVDVAARANGDAGEWAAIKAAYEAAGVRVYADESMCTHADVAVLQPLVHGVNIKLDKAGGMRDALRAVAVAKEHGLHVWVGMMVASNLSVAISAHLLCVATTGGDLDGALLLTQQSQPLRGPGLLWHAREDEKDEKEHAVCVPYGHVGLAAGQHGLGLVPKTKDT